MWQEAGRARLRRLRLTHVGGDFDEEDLVGADEREDGRVVSVWDRGES